MQSALPLGITAFTATTALGAGRNAQFAALEAERTGLTQERFETSHLSCWTGAVDSLAAPLPASLAAWECRNNRLAYWALQQDDFISAVAKTRARLGEARIGLFMGTSTAGIHHSELAYRSLSATVKSLPEWYSHRHTQSSYSIA